MSSLSVPDRHTCYWRSSHVFVLAANAAIVRATSCVGAAPPAADALTATMARRAVAAIYAAALNRIMLLVI